LRNTIFVNGARTRFLRKNLRLIGPERGQGMAALHTFGMEPIRSRTARLNRIWPTEVKSFPGALSVVHSGSETFVRYVCQTEEPSSSTGEQRPSIAARS
jgi:hypothetical protein